MEELLKRKIDAYLVAWKGNPDRKPLIVKGARQIGKTCSIEQFVKHNYKSVIQINFVEQKKYKAIFDDGFEVDTILKNISLLNPEFKFIPGEISVSSRHGIHPRYGVRRDALRLTNS